MVEFSLANKTYSVTRPKLRKWIATENCRNIVDESVDKKDDSGFVSGIYSFLSTLISITNTELEPAPWYEVVEAYSLSALENAPKLDLAMIQSSKKEHSEKLPDAWEYEERTWYAWVHILAGSYHWVIEYIAELDVDDAFALIQEISIQAQYDREWQYGLSDVAYEYDKSSKVSRLKPLPRPSWMTRATHTAKSRIENRSSVVVRTPKSFIPPGLVILDGQENNSNEPARGSTTTSTPA